MDGDSICYAATAQLRQAYGNLVVASLVCDTLQREYLAVGVKGASHAIG